MIFLFRCFFLLCLTLLLPTTLWQCSKANMDTSFLKKIAQPVLQTIENTGEEITFFITQNYNSEQSDIEKILMLSEELTGTFQDFDQGDKTSWSTIEEIPLYKAQSEKLKLSGKNFSITTQIGEEGLKAKESYRLSFVTWGSNTFFKKAHKHNGWFFSKRSEQIDVYISEKNEKTIHNFHFVEKNNNNEHFGVTIDAQNATLATTCNAPLPADKKSSSCHLVYSLENNDSISPHLLVPCQNNQNVGLYPIINNENKNIMHKPVENNDLYICGIDFPAKEGDSFMGKTENAYFRVYVEKTNTDEENKDTETDATIDLFIYIYPSIEKKLTF